MLHGDLNYVYTKQGLGIAAVAVSEKTKVKKNMRLNSWKKKMSEYICET